MPDIKPLYGISQDAAIIRTYSLTTKHIGLLADIAGRLGVNQSEAVRRAIELLYSSLQPSQATLPQKDNGHES